MERIETITEEAQGLRDESINNGALESGASPDPDNDAGAMYFRRATLTETAGSSVQ
jgi:hypothetical protein